MVATVEYRFRVRRRTAASWVTINEVLLESEIGRESDTGRWKYGDGVTAWNSLPYAVDLTGALLASQLDIDATMAANSDGKVPSQKAVKTALALRISTSALDTDTSLSANSDLKVATQKATKAYVDQIVASQDAMVFKGVIDCSANPNYPAADRGWTYRASVAGKIGGSSGVVVQVGDIILCLTDGTASGNQATVGSNWTVIQTNIDGALTTSDIGTSGAKIPLLNGSGNTWTNKQTFTGGANLGSAATGHLFSVATASAVASYIETTGGYAPVLFSGDGGATVGGLVGYADEIRVGPANGAMTGVNDGLFLDRTGGGHFTGDHIGIDTAKTPSSSSAAGVAGTICRDTNYLYVCTATNTWKRAALSTF